jgi:hypothetical protein
MEWYVQGKRKAGYIFGFSKNQLSTCKLFIDTRDDNWAYHAN